NTVCGIQLTVLVEFGNFAARKAERCFLTTQLIF
ncbi:MAG: hypothetical protein ACJATS_001563, partial [Psychroserpens sp.]